MLRANLHEFSGGALHLHHLLAFVDVVAGGLLAVDIFTGLHRPDSGEGVPVIGSRDGDRIHAGIGERLPHVLDFLGLLEATLGKGRLRDFARGLVHVAQHGDPRLRQVRVLIQVIRAASAESDDGDVDLVVCAPNAGGGGGRNGTEKESTGLGICHCETPLIR